MRARAVVAASWLSSVLCAAAAVAQTPQAGTAADGNVTIASTVDCSATAIASGRTQPDCTATALSANGGVLALRAKTSITVQSGGTIDVSGKGFSGGTGGTGDAGGSLANGCGDAGHSGGAGTPEH